MTTAAVTTDMVITQMESLYDPVSVNDALNPRIWVYLGKQLW